jgi:hypothetical protein
MVTSIRTVFGALFGAAFMLWAVILTASPIVQGTRTPRDVAALQQWTVNLEGYLVLRDQAVQEVPRLRLASNARDVLARRWALAAAIRARRPDARVGDLFTFDVRRTFRKLIAHALTDHQIAVGDVMAEITAEIAPGAPAVCVNEAFPWQLGAAMPPSVLAALPSLPQELQYRFVGHDLVLIDLDANLVIDILPEAIPRPATAVLPPRAQ